MAWVSFIMIKAQGLPREERIKWLEWNFSNFSSEVFRFLLKWDIFSHLVFKSCEIFFENVIHTHVKNYRKYITERIYGEKSLSLISSPPSLSQTLLTISRVFFQRMFSHTHTMCTCIRVYLLIGRVAGNANGGLLYLAIYFNDHVRPVSTSFTSSFE